MNKLTSSVLALLLLAGCGATYTKLEPDKAPATTDHEDGDCLEGIDYRTGHCR